LRRNDHPQAGFAGLPGRFRQMPEILCGAARYGTSRRQVIRPRCSSKPWMGQHRASFTKATSVLPGACDLPVTWCR